MTVKRYSYQEIEAGSDVDPGTAFTQALHLLELASKMSVDSKNVPQVLKVTSKWMELGERLNQLIEESDEPEEEVEEEEKPKRGDFGFSHGGLDKQITEVKEDGNGTDEDISEGSSEG